MVIDHNQCTPDEGRGLGVVPVETDAQIQLVAEIRNSCRQGYSYDRETIITPEAQRIWWAAQRGMKAWLFYDDLMYDGPGGSFHSPKPERLIGFGMLRPLGDGEHITTVVGVLPSGRGHDYGLAITRHLVHQAWAPLLGTGAIDNPAAVRLHDPGHWDEITAADPHVRTFRAKRVNEWHGEHWSETDRAWVLA